MVEFTGERVVPGAVNDDLWNEHVARYAFAGLHARDRRVLDAGCGTGYGAAELARSAAEVTAFDIAPEAIAYCRANYPGLRTVVSSCASIPFPANSFDLIVAFEVIEHLADYRTFLDECARVLTHQGLFIVSSPNKQYYAESRGPTGANPYHEHEFEAAEFVSELERVFSNVSLLLQNRVESFVFHPASVFHPAGAAFRRPEARIEKDGGQPDEAHFLIALCSAGALPEPQSFVYVPRAANLLREREHHIQLLERDLSDTMSQRDALLQLHGKLTEELESRTRWVEAVIAELRATQQRVVQLQEEFGAEQEAALAMAAAYQVQIGKLEEENRAQTAWALETAAQLDQKCDELAECVRLLHTAESTLEERTDWAQRVEGQREELARKLDLVLAALQASRWIGLGRRLGLGPVIDQS
ncbi:MAG TPA: methyltransferase domain-containing protein [Bryobacteraceae bacterium]|nr:methyltransferase domain-containing protein [Bryobacteraceae bacterium]